MGKLDDLTELVVKRKDLHLLGELDGLANFCGVKLGVGYTHPPYEPKKISQATAAWIARYRIAFCVMWPAVVAIQWIGTVILIWITDKQVSDVFEMIWKGKKSSTAHDWEITWDEILGASVSELRKVIMLFLLAVLLGSATPSLF